MPALVSASDQPRRRGHLRRQLLNFAACPTARLPGRHQARSTSIFGAYPMLTTRRKWIVQGLAACVAMGTLAVGFFGYEKAARAADPKPMTIGFIYVGSKSDYGYNQAQAEG